MFEPLYVKLPFCIVVVHKRINYRCEYNDYIFSIQ